MAATPRTKRFHIRKDSDLQVSFLLENGKKHEAPVINVSNRGVAFSVDPDSELAASMEQDTLIPNAKFESSKGDQLIGRLLIKFISNDHNLDTFHIGCLSLDRDMPIETWLGGFLDTTLNEVVNSQKLEIDTDIFSIVDFLKGESQDFDIFSKCARSSTYYQEVKKTDRWCYYIPRSPSKGAHIHLKKERKNKRTDFLVSGNNDYYGLAAHPEVLAAAKEAIDAYGFGSTGSSITVGHTEEHEKLEEKLAKNFKTDQAILFNSGYAANLGGISALLGPNDLVVADILSHSSIVDGMKLAAGATRFFRHNDPDFLRKILKRHRNNYAGCLVVVEAVFSMDGDVAPLTEIWKIAKEYGCRVLIDEAHSYGVLGQSGLGLVEEAGLLGEMDVVMGTFSKTCGGIGGFLCGSQEVVDWFKIAARSAFFSVSLPPCNVAAVNKALEIIDRDPSLKERLVENLKYFASGLRELGFDLHPEHRTAILPAIVYDDIKIGSMYQYLFSKGVYTVPAVYPAVAKDQARFRFTATSLHTKSDIDLILFALSNMVEKFGLFENNETDQRSA